MKFTGERYIPSEDKLAEIAIEHMSRYKMLSNIVKDKVVLDAASGEGYGSYLLAQNAKHVIGVDISLEAIQNAQVVYNKSNLEYIQSDVKQMPIKDHSVEVVVSFETIEHVDEETQNQFLLEIKRVLKEDGLLIISTPNSSEYNRLVEGYHNDFHIKEFEKEEFVKFLGQFFKYSNHYDQNFQVLNVITDHKQKVFNYTELEDFHLITSKYVVSVCSNSPIESINLNTITQSDIDQYNKLVGRIFTLQDQVELASSHIKKMFKDVTERDEIINRLTISLNQESEKLNLYRQDVDLIKSLQSQIESASSHINKMYKDLVERDKIILKNQDDVGTMHKIIDERDQIILKNQDHFNDLYISINTLKAETFEKELKINELNECISNQLNTIDESEQTRIKFLEIENHLNEEIDKLNQRIAHMNTQLVEKHEELLEISDWGQANQIKIEQVIEKYRSLNFEMNQIKASDFWKWANRYYRIRDNIWPFNYIYKKIKARNLKKIKDQNIKPNSNVIQKENHDITKEAKENQNALNLLYFSIIDYDFRIQRPQHLAKNLSQMGYNVHYFNANFIKNHNSIEENHYSESLNIIRLSCEDVERVYDLDLKCDFESLYTQVKDYLLINDFRDGVVICNYPNWYPVLEKLNKEFGFEIIFDFLDDFTGFNTNIPDLKYFTDQTFEISKVVLATSDFLFDKASKIHQEVEMVRNGTEYEFFHTANVSTTNDRPIIGYYGAIAEWFNLDIILHLAEQRPNYEIVLIGDYSYSDVDRLRQFSNIKLLGEMNYLNLPEWLAKFDVCLIPFDASTDLIKATNPVKFYEYLSAGKKIVATEIPELEPYKDQFVYLTNEKDKFIEYVDLCIEGEDQLASIQEKMAFAKLQDWSERARRLDQIIRGMYAKISIVIVTYNNQSITAECINSIVEKTKYPNYEIIIVDNASSDSTCDYLKELDKKYDHIKVILNDVNYGFAKGNNIGLREANGEFLLLLNNDTVVTNGWLTGFVKHLKNHKELGMVGPVTNSIGNEAQIDIQYATIDLMDQAAQNYTKIHFNQIYENIGILAMYCVMMPREVFSKVGYLDEIYGIGMFEDDDYANALRKHGYELACAEDVFIHHYGSVSFKKLEDEKYRKVFEENKKKYEEKWNKDWIPHKYRERE